MLYYKISTVPPFFDEKQGLWRGLSMIQENQRLLNQLNVISDGVLVLLSFLFGYWVRFYVLTAPADL